MKQTKKNKSVHNREYGGAALILSFLSVAIFGTAASLYMMREKNAADLVNQRVYMENIADGSQSALSIAQSLFQSTATTTAWLYPKPYISASLTVAQIRTPTPTTGNWSYSNQVLTVSVSDIHQGSKSDLNSVFTGTSVGQTQTTKTLLNFAEGARKYDVSDVTDSRHFLIKTIDASFSSTVGSKSGLKARRARIAVAEPPLPTCKVVTNKTLLVGSGDVIASISASGVVTKATLDNVALPAGAVVPFAGAASIDSVNATLGTRSIHYNVGASDYTVNIGAWVEGPTGVRVNCTSVAVTVKVPTVNWLYGSQGPGSMVDVANNVSVAEWQLYTTTPSVYQDIKTVPVGSSVTVKALKYYTANFIGWDASATISCDNANPVCTFTVPSIGGHIAAKFSPGPPECTMGYLDPGGCSGGVGKRYNLYRTMGTVLATWVTSQTGEPFAINTASGYCVTPTVTTTYTSTVIGPGGSGTCSVTIPVP